MKVLSIYGAKYLEINSLLMDDIKLLGLQRAEFQRAETYSSRSNKAQILIVIISIISVFVNNSNIVYSLTLACLIVAIVWLYFSFQAKTSHSTAERARRAIVLRNGLGIKLSRKMYSDLIMQFKIKENDGTKWENSNYFETTSEYGYKKLTDIVEESSFWSKHLFRISAIHYWVYFVASLCLSIVGLTIIPLLNIGSLNILVSRVFCLILIWLITGNLFTTAMAFTSTANSIDAIESRLSNMVKNLEPDEDILILVGDYNSLLESTPTIPSKIYLKNRDKLNRLWDERNAY